jgi:probable H4MPT-linked C1 transfer pathway protein
MNLVGFDIGGANLKAADGRGRAVQVPFPLWKLPGQLTGELHRLLQMFGAVDEVAVTMTGELCDCFETKSAGVRHILGAVQSACGSVPIHVWTTAGDFRPPAPIEQEPLLAAAANWLALAQFAGRFVPANGLLIDLGSTTCDIIPLVAGAPRPVGRTDPDRLVSGELVYCGVRRTPLCALFGLTKAAEWFATTADAYVVLGDLPEEPERADSADGRPLTRAHAKARLARMECDEAWSWEQAVAFARQVRDRQIQRVAAGVAEVAARLPGPVELVVMAGAGEFLVPAILTATGLGLVPRVSLGEKLGPSLSTAACAHAVAVLASESPRATPLSPGGREGARTHEKQHAVARSDEPTPLSRSVATSLLICRDGPDTFINLSPHSREEGAERDRRPHVVKVGGSLYDLPNLGMRLKTLLASLTPPVLIVPGGGMAADAIREFDRVHRLGDEASHWLALRACSLNGHFLAKLLGDLPITADVATQSDRAVVDLLAFALDDERRPDHFPHRWEVTSDSMALRVAHVAGARALTLLKSVAVPTSWLAAAAKGMVDPYFPTALACATGIVVRAIHYRATDAAQMEIEARSTAKGF